MMADAAKPKSKGGWPRFHDPRCIYLDVAMVEAACAVLMFYQVLARVGGYPLLVFFLCVAFLLLNIYFHLWATKRGAR